MQKLSSMGQKNNVRSYLAGGFGKYSRRKQGFMLEEEGG